MGTKERLRKASIREAKSLGHELGCFLKRYDGTYEAKCLHCLANVIINPDFKFVVGENIGFDNEDGSITRFKSYDDNYGRTKFKVKDIIKKSKNSKGYIYGTVFNFECIRKFGWELEID